MRQSGKDAIQIDRKKVTTEFLKLEVKSNLFDIRSDGVPVWERVRFRVHREILKKMGISNQAHISKSVDWKSYLHAGYLWLKDGLFNNPFLADQHDILFTGQRRKLHEDGYWWDLICDPIHDNTDLDALHMESIGIHGPTQKPAKTDDILYLDFLKYTASLKNKIGLVNPDIDQKTKKLISDLENKINSRFNVDIDVYSLIKYKLAKRASEKPLYDRLLMKIDPEIAIIQPGYGSETLIEACADAGITTIELQHGTIYPGHLGYSYAPPRKKRDFPDYLFTWGEFWNSACKFPIPQDHVIPIGYPYLSQQEDKYSNVPSQGNILFISQGTIGEQLSKFAVNVSKSNCIDYDIIYKLHPGEYKRWKHEYPWLKNANITVIDSSPPSLYKLFSQAEIQIGVGSTALYEGLVFDLDTFIYDLPGKEAIQPLIDDGVVAVINSLDELETLHPFESKPFNRERFFKKNPVSNFKTEINRIL